MSNDTETEEPMSAEAVHIKEMYDWMEKMLRYEYEEAIRETARNFQELYKRIEEQEHLTIMKLEMEREESLESIQKNYEKILKLQNTKSTMKKDSSKKLVDKEIGKYTKNMTNCNITRLGWDMDAIDNFLIQLCITEDHMKYTQPYWSKAMRGTEDDEIETPRGIAIDPLNNYLYIVDSGDYTDRIQVYDDSGDHLQSLEGNGEMVAPFGIYIYENYIYVTCMDSHLVKDQTCIMKLDKTNGNVIGHKDTIDPIHHPFVDSEDDHNIRIYGCGMYSHRLHVFDEDLEFVEGSPIYLQTLGDKSEDTELEYRTKVMSVKVFNKKVFLLLALTEHAVQVFDLNGVLLQTLIDDIRIQEPFAFCFDIFNNIILADRRAHRISLYSSITGNLLREIGEGSGTDIGEFNGPKGVVLGKRQQFIILDSKDMFTLQAF